MNLPPVMRAAACSALVIVCLAGAGWFLTQPVAGQEIKHHSYRPGLRNSFVERRLSAEELNLTLAQLRRKTGFARMRFDEAGFLTIDDRSQIAGGSATARQLLLAAVDGKKSINLQTSNRSPEVVFARVGERVKLSSWRSDEQIELAPIEIDFADFNHLRGEREVLEAFDLGFAILHELCHVALELRDPPERARAAGDCESYVNRIRRELGMPERRQYAANVFQRASGIALNKIVAQLSFAQNRPGAKTKWLYLTWEVRDVGNNHH